MCLWQRDKVTGSWILVRCVTASHAEAWKRMYQKKHPHETFAISKTKPKTNRSLRAMMGQHGNPELKRLLKAS